MQEMIFIHHSLTGFTVNSKEFLLKLGLLLPKHISKTTDQLNVREKCLTVSVSYYHLTKHLPPGIHLANYLEIKVQVKKESKGFIWS